MSFDWITHDGEKRSALAWEVPDPKAIVACLHGMSGAAEQFEPMGGRWPGVSVFATDLRGQGNDPVATRRGICLDTATQHRDIASFVESLRAAHPGVPVFLAGESMGALLTISFAANHPAAGLAGLILSVPVVELRRPVPPPVRQIVRFLATVAPRLRCRPSLFVNGKTLSPPLTRDKDYQDSMRDKPHYIRDFTFRFLAELGDLIEVSHRHAAALHLPCLVLAAGKDCFVTREQIETWHRKIASPSKRLHVYPEAYHLLWHDWDRDEVLDDIGAWLAEHRENAC